MRALILAAGRGSRMGEKTSERPKCLLEVGGKALIEHQLEALADCGIGPVGIVVGYCADEVREVVGFRAEFIENSIWRRTNSLYSFWLARDWVDGPLLVLNSDLLLDPKIIEALVKAGGDALAFDSASGDGAEQMKLQIHEGHLVSMSKTLPEADVGGENVGVLKFDASTAQHLFDLAAALIEQGGENDWLSSAVSKFAAEKPLEAVDIAGLPWAEIDFPFDLDRARKRVWPAIRANTRKRSWPWRVGRLGGIAAALGALVLTNLLWASTPRSEWESLELFGLDAVRVTSETREERWWRLDDDHATTFSVGGPARLRIESRIVDPEAARLTRYAVEVALDEVPMKWKDRLARPSKKWRAADQPLGKLTDFEIEVPEGSHTIRLRLIGEAEQSCLIRVAQELGARESEE